MEEPTLESITQDWGDLGVEFKDLEVNIFFKSLDHVKFNIFFY